MHFYDVDGSEAACATVRVDVINTGHTTGLRTLAMLLHGIIFIAIFP